MTVREYIGARYVPLFMGDWDVDADYEPLSIVQYQGNSYTSRQAVPHGVDITNTAYWAITGNYNAQVEAYRQEVQGYNQRLNTVETSIDAINGKFPLASTDIADNAVTTTKIADSAITSAKIADNAVTTTKIADSAITSAKIADGAITTEDIANGAISYAKLDSDVQDRIDAIVEQRHKKMLTFGDSWIADSNKTVIPNCWVILLADALGLKLVNYARSGAYISYPLTAGSPALGFQINEAINAISSDERDDYEYIFIMGGVNDYHSSSVTAATFQSGLTNNLNTIKAAFPNSKIVLIPMNVFYEQVGTNNKFQSMMFVAQEAAMNTDCICLDGLASFFRLYGQSVYRPNDDSSYSAGGGTYHPNNEGNRRICAWILRNMFSMTAVRHPITLAAASANFTISENHSWTDGKFVYWNFKCVCVGGIAAGFHAMANTTWSNYPVVLADVPGTDVLPLTKPALTGTDNCIIFVKNMGHQDALGANTALIFYTPSTSTGSTMWITGVTPIMGAI